MNEYPQFLQDPQTLVSIRTEFSVFIPWVIHPRIGESKLYIGYYVLLRSLFHLFELLTLLHLSFLISYFSGLVMG